MKKKLGQLILLLLFGTIVNAQIIAGDSLSPGLSYTDIEDDSLVMYHNSWDTVSYDVDNDGIRDLKFLVYQAGGMGGNTMYERVYRLHQNIEIAVIPSSTNCVDTMQNGTLIDGNRIWGNSSSYYTMTSGGFITTQTGPVFSGGGYFAGKDKYMGFRIIGTANVIYGWFLVNSFPQGGWSYNKIYKAYAIGVSTVGIDELSNSVNDIVLQPQPAMDVIYMQSTQLVFRQEDIPHVYDISGTQIKLPVQYINTNTYKLDVSELSGGMYVITIKTEKGIVRKKVVVQNDEK